MPEEKAKKNTGLIIGIACGAVAVIAIVIVLIIVLTSGGLKGKYTLTGMVDKDGKDMSGLISLMSIGGAAPSIEFKDGGKCEANLSTGMSYSEEEGATAKTAKADCTFTKDEITVTMDGEKDVMKYTVDGDKITVFKAGEDEKMIFTKQ